MRGSLVRAAVLALLAPLALGGAFGHVDGFERLSQGTFLFPPDHPAHAPFVPQKEHPCAACAVANVARPEAAPLFLVPPAVRFALEIDVPRAAADPALPELPGRSPPLTPA